MRFDFINMLLGVSLMPGEEARPDLPVIRLHASTPSGIWLKQPECAYSLTPLAWWREAPEEWSAYEHVGVTIEGHSFFDTGIVVWDTPEPLPGRTKHEERFQAFLTEKQEAVSSALFFVSGKLEPECVEFLKRWPLLLRRTTILLFITERKSENECQLIESSIRDVAKRELNNVPVKLFYAGDVFEEFHMLSHEMRPNYSDAELAQRWKEIRGDTDGMARKYSSKTTGSQISELLEKTVEWEEIDYHLVADEVLRQYANNNVTGAQYELGTRLMEQDEYTEAIQYFRMLADKDHAEAMYNLSQCYFEGKGAAQNIESAVRWTRAAADAGHSQAQFLMFTLLSTGEHMKQNGAQAVEFLKKAAYSNHVRACSRLGELYLAGIDVAVNYDLGIKFLTIAVDAGDADAMVMLAASYKKGYGVRKDAVEMYRLLERAAALNQPDALVALGDAYLRGTDVTADPIKAFRYFLKAADVGAADAQMRVGACYEKGDGVAADIGNALRFYTKAAEQGDAEAQCYLGSAFRSGVVVVKDLQKARHWLTLASASGNTRAQEHLADMDRDTHANDGAVTGDKCFVVTASFGDEQGPEVIFYRNFRDAVLLRRAAGRFFIAAYYRIGPSLARILTHNTLLRKIARVLLRHLRREITRWRIYL